ncbi:conjugal transfer protein [Paenibacillus athensensis]|uniref:Conjugal transfer protein n=1 Tax=Paenibacillus athensensis TaxID=1967502 RepID=A0A4Y8Q004_9BACL|nr:conjugal transfer protein [Paenibacillus athensensis]MCD1261284.1 conjugal transfer protein [Paenibacillus athensensis]
MDIRIIPKALIWGMLTLSTLGAISSWVKPEADRAVVAEQAALKQQMAVHTATNFAREWMTWSGEELPEDRLNRLKPYVNPSALARIGQIKTEQKSDQQKVVAAEFVSLSEQDAPKVAVRIRVIVLNPARTVWEVEVPVWVQLGKGAMVTAPPLMRIAQEPFAVSEIKRTDPAVPGSEKERMRPAVEGFLKVMCEGKDAESLLNYVRTDTKLTPLQGRIHFNSLDHLEASGSGPSYTASATFTVKDAATGISFAQVWQLAVTEENQKFFIGAIHP